MSSRSNPEQYDIIIQRYVKLVEELPNTLVSDFCLQEQMKKWLQGAQRDFTETNIKRRSLDIVKKTQELPQSTLRQSH